MADYTRPAFTGSIAKPELRRRVKGRAKRKARAVVKSVRERVGDRDGDCRIGNTTRLFGPCDGVSEWMHLEDSRRFKTVGQPAAVRHTTAGTCRGCTRHHRMYDVEKTLTVEFLDHGLGADSTMRFEWNGIRVLSVPLCAVVPVN
jgi:hypothetical protein